MSVKKNLTNAVKTTKHKTKEKINEYTSKLQEDLKSGGYFRYKYDNVYAFFYSSLDNPETEEALKSLATFVEYRIYQAVKEYRSINERIDDVNKNEKILLLPAGSEYKTVSKDRVIIVKMSKTSKDETKYKTKVMKLNTFEKNYLESRDDEPTLFDDEEAK